MNERVWDAVFFDLDGTLADTEGLILESFRHAWESHGSGPPPVDDFLAMMGVPLPRQIRALASDEAQAEAMRQTYVVYQRSVHDERVTPFPGAARLLEDLRAAGTRVAVVTSKHSGLAERTLRCCGLWDPVEYLIGWDQVARPKPDPEAVHLALARTDLADRPERVVFVGDSPFDIRAGRGAGVRTAAAVWGAFSRETLDREGPDFVLDDLEGLRVTAPG